MTTARCALVLSVVLSSLTPAAMASAQSGDAAELETEARARFSLGQLYYSQARFAEAATEFEAAYAAHAHPLLLHNIYLARRDMGDIAGAVDALTRYLATATDLAAADRRLLEGRLAAMRHQLEASPPTHDTPPPPQDEPVVGDTAPVEAPDTLADPRSDPPDAAPAETTQPDTAQPTTTTGDDGLVTGGIVAFSFAGAALLTMVITGPLALSERDRLASSCAPTCTDEQVSTARTLGGVTDTAIGIAAVAAATGVVLTVLGVTSSHSDVEVTPSVSADHAALFVGGHF
jgi:hypothetical protein